MLTPAHPFRLQVHPELASTSDACIEQARSGAADGLAILAHIQTAGRGTQGRAWSSPSGNLALSVLLRPQTTAAEAGNWSLVAGVAVIEALSPFIRSPAVLQLKWPNDVLLDGAKLAGVLVETAATQSGTLDWLVIGIGANLAQAPDLPNRATACLAQHATPPDAVTAASAVLTRLGHWRTRLAREGFAPIRAAWLARAHPLETPLRVTTPAGPREGTFAGLSETGALLLRRAGRIEPIVAAEVQPLSLAS